MRQTHDLKRLEVSAHFVDARGKACPAPILELAKALRASARVEVWADDRAAPEDLRAFCELTGHTLIARKIDGFAMLRAVVARRS